MHATDITATITRPADQYGSDWNWAEVATEAWLAAARDAGITIEAEDYDDHGDSVAARVRADGTWYDLEVGRGGDPDEVRAVKVEATTTYAAHIVTAEAHNLGDPEVIVMTDADETSAADPIAHYPLTDRQNPIDVLKDNGWRIIGGTTEVETGYLIVDVEAIDHEQIIKHVTFARAQADAEYQQQDTAWRTLIRDAMRDRASGTRLADAAGVSRERIYQIRDGRR